MTETAPRQLTRPLVFVDANTEKRNFPCSSCGKAFKRSEHRARHERGHTQEKPFSCQFCRRRYARRDLVVRHERLLHPDRSGNQTKPAEDPKSNLASKKVPHATTTPMIETRQNPDYGAQPVSPPSSVHNTASATLPETRLQDRLNQSGEVSSAQTAPMSPGTGSNLQRSPSIPQDDSHMANYNLPSNIPYNQFFHTLEDDDLLDPFASMGMFSNMSFDQLSALEPESVSGRTSAPRSSQSEPHPSQNDQDFKATINNEPPQLLSCGATADGYTAGVDLPNTASEICVDQNLPRIAKTRGMKPQPPSFTDIHRVRLMMDLNKYGGGEKSVDIKLPRTGNLQKLLQTFAESYLVHQPFIHLPSLDFDQTPSALVLAMCAFGALFRLEADLSSRLFLQAEWLLNAEISKLERHHHFDQLFKHYDIPLAEPSCGPLTPLWITQCNLLLTVYGAFTGNQTIVRKALEATSSLAMEYRNRMHEVKIESRHGDDLYSNWPCWCEYESKKRVLHAIFIFSNLLTATYGITPTLSVLQDAQIELPCPDDMWYAENQTSWRRAILDNSGTKKLTVQDGMSLLMAGADGEKEESVPLWSPFATVIILHGISVHFWHLSQYTHMLHKSAEASSQDRLVMLVLNCNATALARCHAHITGARATKDHAYIESEEPLLFNSMAVLRLIYLRGIVGGNVIDRMLLLSYNATQIISAVQTFVAAPQPRNNFITRAAMQIFEGIIAPSQSGWKLIQKTAAMSWSIEIAISGYDCGLFFMKWLYIIEQRQKLGLALEAAELTAIDNVRFFSHEYDIITDESHSLASELCRYWASLYDDTWTWGVTPRFGFVLRTLANACDQSIQHH